jgi:hypothetical protein
MRRVTLLATGAVLAGLALAGCGAKQAAEQQQGQQNQTMAQTLQLLAEKVGANSGAKQGVHLTMSMDTMGQSVKADGDMKFGSAPGMDLNYELPGIGSAKMILANDVFYFQLPTQLATGKPWVKIDVDGDDPLSKALGGALKETKKNSDPSQVLTQIKDAGQITGTTQENLNGKATTHYSVTVDINKAVEKLDPSLRSELEKVAKAGVSTYPLEVWVDQESLPVRITVDTPFTNPSTQQTDQVKMTLDYSDWGKAVTIAAPPADQVGTYPGR